MRRLRFALLAALLIGIIAVAAWWLMGGQSDSNILIRRWLENPGANPDLKLSAKLICPGAPFLLPSEGFIGLLWADPAGPYTVLNRHSGIDIFGAGAPGTVPVYAAADGFLTRLPDWKSTIIIRHNDPLEPGRIIWTYYTHLANRDGSRSFIVEDFPPGTAGAFVQQGTLLGYQGEFSGTGPPIAMHVHFSIVRSDDNGAFLNEAQLENTLDPSPYLGMKLNLLDGAVHPAACT